MPTRRVLALPSLTLAALLVSTLTASSQGPVTPQLTDPRHPLLNQGPKAVAEGDRVMVSTQLPAATKAALDVLRDGGNAVDAAIAATLVQCVIDFHQTSLFGSMTGIYYEAKTGRFHAFNAYAERPRSDRPGGQGDAMKVAIAGKVRALDQLRERWGTRPWASYFGPAIETAEQGFVMTSFMFASNYADWAGSEWIRGNPAAREVFMPDGHLVPVGGTWKMPALATTLRRLAQEGPEYMHSGEWAQKFVAEAGKRGGRVTLDDLKEYEVMWLEPLRFTYRGHEIVTEPPPVAGGSMLGYNLTILEQFDLARSGHYAESLDTLEIIARTFGRVENEVRYSMGDPRGQHVPTSIWLSKDYGRLGAEVIRQTMPKVSLAPATTTAAVGAEAALDDPINPYHDDSNHNVIVDAEGNWISYLHTMHGGAPDMFIDGVRVIGSGRWAQTTGPGRRTHTAIAATFVLKDGKPWLSIGSPGLPAMPVTVTLLNVLDFGLSPDRAADAPRFWAYRDRGPSRDFGNLPVLEIESRISDEVRAGLRGRGIQVRDLGPYNWNTGSMQIVWRDLQTGKLRGATDPRRLGHAEGY
ncbi:MAG: gamma-glutamyltransferase [Acidobacteria bacterium]|nr:gamma-glutamyltransferase [Acidobacteriota bacterium]